MAYGGPDSLDDVEPYLLDVRGGRPMQPAMVEEMRERYRVIGGRSPILQRTQAQAHAVQEALSATDGDNFRCFVGMRHWTPRIATALSDMEDAGIDRAIGLVMAPHYSRMSVGAYFEAVEEARSRVEIASIERWHLLPELLDSVASRIVMTLAEFPEPVRHDVRILFTAHSLPERILEWHDPYPDELHATVEAVVQRLRAVGGSESLQGAVLNQYEFAYQSAAMTPDPWLGPDAGEVIERLHGDGVPGALIVPVGFTSAHVEILYDIDVEYAQLAMRLKFLLRRIAMLNDDARTMTGLARLVRERADEMGWV